MSTVPLTELACDLRIACLRLTRRLRCTKMSALPPHFFSLLAKLDEGDCTAAELACRERVSAPSMSRTVAELIERGLATRHPDAHDRRRLQIAITDAGRVALQSARQERNQWVVEHLETLTEQERATLAKATVIINKILDHE